MIFRTQVQRADESRLTWDHKRGLSTFTPVPLKSRTLRVTTVRLRSRAVAAIIVSRTGRVIPFFFNPTSSPAQRRLTAASHGRHSIALTTALNHSSSWPCLRRLGSARNPNEISISFPFGIIQTTERCAHATDEGKASRS